ncbi:helix-turn-helix transcriptional regulator [Methyloterricola oryzae]|uniref:helix-turn-helix transcriptional regulator n=1 Tax=Methyloterricola oryzae TaxID=1495050 RepID=UPI0005EBED35|nr:WYL domain-containing protein [Methyloterricola oryzae]
MDRTERFYRIEQLLHEHRVVPVARFLEALNVSIATFKRDLEYLRDRLGAPIVWDRQARAYRFQGQTEGTTLPAHELPGLWFNASEIHALLTMRQLLAQIQPGLLDAHIQPLLTRLNTLLASGDHTPAAVEQRVRVLPAARRRCDSRLFPQVAQALLQRKRLTVTHYNRSNNETTVREISPQRLVHYRDNWYLDAWCHLREGLRSFAVDALEQVTVLPTQAIEVDESELDAELAGGYGIFSGTQVHWALLRFTPERSRWVQAEHWHPQQQGQWDEQGRYCLTLPYTQPQELLMDILRNGDQVEVLEPEALRQQVQETAQRLAALYQK